MKKLSAVKSFLKILASLATASQLITKSSTKYTRHSHYPISQTLSMKLTKSINTTPSYNCPICYQPFLLTPYTRIYCAAPSNHLIIHTNTHITTLVISFPTHEILIQDNAFYYILNSNPNNAIKIQPTRTDLDHLLELDNFSYLIAYINQFPKYIPFS